MLRAYWYIPVFAAGCSSGSTITAPTYDAAALAQKCLDAYDANKDGTLAGPELDACPGLKAAIGFIDTNKDKKLGADELKARFTMYQQNKAGSIGIGVRVLVGDVPLEGATVTFTPEPFLKDVIKGGSGVTDKTGSANIAGEAGVPGLQAGLYRVAIVKGAEVPAKYNAQTTLGREVAAGGGREATAGGFEFVLTK